jgi:NADH:ubiquinone oxidoreductase subunit 2 (subunit N)
MTLALMTAVPIATALLLVVLGSRIGRSAAVTLGAGALVVALGAAAAVGQAFAAGKTSLVAELGPWLPIRGAAIAFVVDSRGVWLLLATTTIGAVLGIYAAVRLRRDPGAVRFFIALDVLVASLLLVLMARDLVLLLAGSQGVGIAAYLLIAQDRAKTDASTGAARAFVFARVADAALVLAVLGLLALFQTVDLDEINGRLAASAPARPADALIAASVLIVVAALIRLGQLPFHAWLPGRWGTGAASLAAVHGLATTAGAFLLIRLAPVIDPAALLGAATTGVASAIVALLAALVDVRALRVRWLTVAQLGIVTAACALASPSVIVIVVGSSVILTAVAVLGERWHRLARFVSSIGVAGTAAVLASGPLTTVFLAGVLAVAVLATADALLGVAEDRIPGVGAAVRRRSPFGGAFTSVGAWIVRVLQMTTTLVERGGEQAIATIEDAIVRSTGRVSTAVDRFHRSSLLAHEALLVVTAVVLAVYWIVR